jgi:hypothetical protein
LTAGANPATTELLSLKSATARKAATHLTATADMAASEAAAHMAAATEATTMAATAAAVATTTTASQSPGRDGGRSQCDGGDEDDRFVQLDILHGTRLSFDYLS